MMNSINCCRLLMLHGKSQCSSILNVPGNFVKKIHMGNDISQYLDSHEPLENVLVAGVFL